MVVEHFLLRDLVVVRHDDASPSDDARSPGLVLGGVVLLAMADFHVAGKRCLAGVADPATAHPIGPEAGAGTDFRGRAPTAVTLGGASFDLWQLPEWHVDDSTVLHLVLTARDGRPVTRDTHRALLAGLQIEHDGAQVLPVSMGTYGGNTLIQCTAEVREPLVGLTARVVQTARTDGS